MVLKEFGSLSVNSMMEIIMKESGIRWDSKMVKEYFIGAKVQYMKDTSKMIKQMGEDAY